MAEAGACIGVKLFYDGVRKGALPAHRPKALHPCAKVGVGQALLEIQMNGVTRQNKVGHGDNLLC